MLEGPRPCAIFCLCSHTLAELRNRHVSTFILVSSSGTNHDLLCFVHGQGKKREQQRRTKNFAKLHNNLPL